MSQKPGNGPKVFISYSWTSAAFQNQVRLWAERLTADGVDILFDQFDLREGQDKYAYMEKMVTDPSVTHVVMFIDKRYSEKANERKAGVGTESQIISKEIYEKVNQSKFIPIVCEVSEIGVPFLPVFVGSRIWIDFSSEESTNKNWERLIRHLFGKPLFEKPQIGNPPAYISEASSVPSNPASGKFSVFRNAFLSNQKGIKNYRRDFLEACIAYVDGLRARTKPDVKSDKEAAEHVVEVFRKLTPARNLLIDWVLLEAESENTEVFETALIEFLEALLELRERPSEVNSWSEWWFAAHQIFVYELALYIVAALLRVGAYKVLNSVLMGSYLSPEQIGNGSNRFTSFSGFYAYSDILNLTLAPEGRKYHAPAAELLSRSAERRDIPFVAIKEADALAYLAAVIRGNRWYPQTHYYWGYGTKAPFFVRATQHKNFVKLAAVLGIESGDKLRERVTQQIARDQEQGGWSAQVNFTDFVNLAALDTIN